VFSGLVGRGGLTDSAAATASRGRRDGQHHLAALLRAATRAGPARHRALAARAGRSLPGVGLGRRRPERDRRQPVRDARPAGDLRAGHREHRPSPISTCTSSPGRGSRGHGSRSPCGTSWSATASPTSSGWSGTGWSARGSGSARAVCTSWWPPGVTRWCCWTGGTGTRPRWVGSRGPGCPMPATPATCSPGSTPGASTTCGTAGGHVLHEWSAGRAAQRAAAQPGVRRGVPAGGRHPRLRPHLRRRRPLGGRAVRAAGPGAGDVQRHPAVLGSCETCGAPTYAHRDCVAPLCRGWALLCNACADSPCAGPTATDVADRDETPAASPRPHR
jgi:hypothetical protein